MTTNDKIYYPTKITNQQHLSVARSVQASEHIDAIREKWLAQVPTGLQRLFPNAIQRLINQRELEIVNVELKYERDCMRYLHEVELAAIKEQLQAQLIQYKEKTRRELSKDLAKHSENLEVELENLLQDFYDQWELIMERIRERKTEKLRSRSEKRMDELLDRVEERRKILMDNYNIVFEGLSQNLHY